MASNVKALNIDEFLFEDKAPSAEEHHVLRKQAGLTPPPRPDNEISLKNSFCAVTVRTRNGNQAIAMGRVIGDGAIFLVVVDMAVLPQYQRKGLGQAILDRLLAYVDKHAPNAHLSLLADPPGVKLYERVGFTKESYEQPMLRSQYFITRRKELGLGEFGGKEDPDKL